MTTTSAKDLAYRVVYDRIADGHYAAGSWLREDDVAAEAGVSRTPVREAFHRLQAEGLVELVRHRGALVVGWTADDLNNLYDLRVVLECYGARRAAAQCEAATVRGLYVMCEEMEAELPGADEVQLQALGRRCIDFHFAVQAGSGNRQLVALMPNILAAPFVSEAFHYHTRDDLARSFAHHRELVDAIAAGDGDWAEGVMRAHLRHGRWSLRRMERRHPMIAVDGAHDDAATVDS